MRIIVYAIALATPVVACGKSVRTETPAAPAAPTPRAQPGTPARAAAPLGAPRSCGAEDHPRIASGRVGALHIDMRADSVRRVCFVVREQLYPAEDDTVRALVIALSSSSGDTLRAFLEQRRVTGIVVESPRFVVGDSIRVGMPVSRLFGLTNLSGQLDEGNYYAESDDATLCGVVFQIRFAQHPAPVLRRISRETLEPYAETAKIAAIVVQECLRR